MNSEEAGWLAEGDQASSGSESGPEVGSLASLQLQRHSSSSSSLVVLSPHHLHFNLPSIPRVALLPGNIQLSHSVCLTSALFLLPELLKSFARAVFLLSTKTFCSRLCPTTADTLALSHLTLLFLAKRISTIISTILAFSRSASIRSHLFSYPPILVSLTFFFSKSQR